MAKQKSIKAREEELINLAFDIGLGIIGAFGLAAIKAITSEKINNSINDRRRRRKEEYIEYEEVK